MSAPSAAAHGAHLGAAATATTALGAQPPAAADEVAGAYIVELDAGDSPAAFYTRLARDHGIAAEHRMDLASRALFHGASFRVPNATTAGELRDALARNGVRFHSRCDTELIPAAYRAWGDDCVTRFRGDFAFGLYDFDRRRLLLAREGILQRLRVLG